MENITAVNSDMHIALQILKQKATQELESILNWWASHTLDEYSGGFYGRIDGMGKVHPLADKAIILNARILWTFAATGNAYSERKEWRDIADRAFDYLLQYFWDRKEGGVYWMLDCYGKPVQDKKQIYAQAFAIYALSEYYQLTKNREALEKAREIFGLVEQYSRDKLHGGYFEAFSRQWLPLSDLRLSEKDANEAKTVNTHLHILEAYTRMYQVFPDTEIRNALRALVVLFLEKFIDPETSHLRLFFDETWVLKSDLISFGHDIETAWLLCKAAEILDETELLAKVQQSAIAIAARTLVEGIDSDGALFNEANTNGFTDKNKDWWPQAEAVVGFLNAWQRSGDQRYAKAALISWGFIEKYLLDQEQGEWFWGLYANGTPDRDHDKVGPWKCPYHNSRACLEVINRL